VKRMSEGRGTQPDVMAAEVRNVLRSRRTWGNRSLWVTGLLALLALALLIWWWPRPDPIAWDTHVVERGELILTATATGNLEPQREVMVGAEISGLIREVLVSENDRIAVGAVLARFDTEELEVSLEQAEARLALAGASVEEAEATLEEVIADERRIAGLVAHNLASHAQLDAARAAVKRAVARVSHAQASVREARGAVSAARTRLAKSIITSPIDGVVLKRNVEPGNTVAATLQSPELFLLAEDLDRMELHVALDEADVGMVRPGQSARFMVDAWPGVEFQAEVLRVHLYPVIEAGVVTYTTVLDVCNVEGLLLPGMTATATITTGTREQALRVPNVALRFVPPAADGSARGPLITHPGQMRAATTVGAGNTVWVLRNGQPHEVQVVTGQSDGRFTEILDGEVDVGGRVVVGVRRPRS
jgi:HlyD family secretion protein